MYDSMYFPQLEPLNAEEQQRVIDNIKLVWDIYHSWKNKLGYNTYDMDDLFSIGVLALIKAVKTYSPAKGTLSTWASIIIANQYRNFQRYCYRKKPTLCCKELKDNNAVDESSIDDIIERVYASQAMKQAELSSQESQVLIMYMGENMTQQEIANKLGLSQSQVSRLKTRALRKMQRIKPN